MRSIKRLIVSTWLLGVGRDAHAALDSAGLFDDIVARYSNAASAWASVITDAASWLFWVLVLMSMVWTFGMMALRKADIGEFFAEFVRFTIFTGFFWWLLINGPNFATDIMESLQQLGGNATGLRGSISPSGIVDIGFDIFKKVIDKSSVWSPVYSAVGIIAAFAILVILALIGVNMLLLLTAGWILAYGGVFFLGFGGARWTSDMAINYYKTVLGIAAQLLAMVLLIGIGKTFLDDYYANMTDSMPIKELGVILIVAVILLMLVNKVPQLIAGIITGASVGGMGIGQFGAGAMVGAAGMAAAAASMAGAMATAGATQGAGGIGALMAAFSQANANVASGSDILSGFMGGDDGGGPGPGGGGGGGAGIGDTPLAKAAGYAGLTPAGAGISGGSSGRAEASGGGSSGDNDAKGGDDGGTDSAKGSGQTAGSASGQDAQGGQGAGGFTETGRRGGVMAAAGRAAGTAGRVGADAASNLAKGTYDVAKTKVGSLKDAAMERIADSTGGRIAAAIKGQASRGQGDSAEPAGAAPGAPSFDDNNLAWADSREADPESEVAAFVNRDSDSQTA